MSRYKKKPNRVRIRKKDGQLTLPDKIRDDIIGNTLLLTAIEYNNDRYISAIPFEGSYFRWCENSHEHDKLKASYHPPYYGSLESYINELNKMNIKEDIQFKATITGNKVKLPDALRSAVGIDNFVSVLYHLNHLEIWDYEKWEKTQDPELIKKELGTDLDKFKGFA